MPGQVFPFEADETEASGVEQEILAIRILDNALHEPDQITPKVWFAETDPKNVVAFDVEFVEPIPKGSIRAATVCVCSLSETFNFKVQHLPGTFKVTPHSYEVTGFKINSLVDGKSFNQVRKAVGDLLQGKLVVGCALLSDFKALDLDPWNYQLLDLQEFFKKVDASGPQPISLRTLYWHYFGMDIQDGVHEAQKDAKATLKLFHDVYCKLKTGGLEEERHLKGTNNFEQFKNIERLPRSRATLQELIVKQKHLKIKYMFG